MCQNDISTPKKQIRKKKYAKLLVLGTADAGKSTLIRHMRQLHGQQFGNEEITHFRKTIQISCLEYLISIIPNFLKEHTMTAADQQSCENFLDNYKSKSEHDREFIDEALKIWHSSSLQTFIKHLIIVENWMEPMSVKSFDIEGPTNTVCPVSFSTGQRLHSDNPASHFLRCFNRIMAKEYQPKVEDILNLRVPTTGIFFGCH